MAKEKKKKLKVTFDVGNEQVILATMMKDKPTRIKLSNMISENHFVGKRHKVIFSILKGMDNLEFNEDTFDVLSEGKEYGGYEYITELQKYFDANENIDVHVKKLIKDSVKNTLKNKVVPELEELIENPSTELTDIQDILSKADLRIRNSFMDNMVESGDVLKKRYKLELRQRNEGIKEVIGFGFPELDNELVEGALPGKVITITARPSMGKTTFASNIINYWTGTLKKKVLACPLETGTANLMDYIVVQRANKKKQGMLKLNDILRNMKHLDIAKKHKINKIVDEMTSDECLNVADSRELSLSKLKVILQNGDYDIAIIDLFEKLSDVISEGPNSNLGQKLEEVQRIAQETKTCIVIVSQLKRFGKNTSDKKPDMEQIKNSGKYEEISDIIIGLYREHYYDKEVDDIVEIMVLKQRNGLRNYSASYEFLGNIATIGEYAEIDESGW